MTTWTESPEGGRDRGPVGLARAWIEVLARPQRFFANGVAPGDQAPGLAFAVAVVLAYVGGVLAVDPTRILSPDRVPILGGSTALTVLLVLLVTALVVAPAGLHLLAAIQTVVLIAVVDDRAGVSETVQVLGYALAPAALAWLPLPGVAAVCALYGTGLLIRGLGVVHGIGPLRATLAAGVPAALVFWGAFGGLASARSLAALGGL